MEPGSLITRHVPPDERPLTALACKRNITVVDVTSTRMLLAHGFLRRVFEVFEQHATSVDVVTTSEVSVSMTLDDDRRLAAIERDLRLIADVQVERGDGNRQRRRRQPAPRSRAGGETDCGARRIAAADGVAGGVPPEPDGRSRRSRMCPPP